MNISLIVAMDQNRAIGYKNQLLWHLPSDLKRFKKTTMGKPIVMGRKTFESIGKMLPGRENIVLTRDANFSNNVDRNSNLTIYNNLNLLLEYLNTKYNSTEVMIIGGAEVYKLFLEYANKIYFTVVDTSLDKNNFIEADTYFPEIDNKTWKEDISSLEKFSQDSTHKYSYMFIQYNKII